jgi:Spy/CpxP family protein refolding chaperone
LFFNRHRKEPNMADHASPDRTPTRVHTLWLDSRRTRRALASMVAASAVVGAAWAGDATSAPPPERSSMHAERHGSMGEHGGFGPGLFHGSPERIERGVDRMLDGLKATDAQRTQVKQIAVATAADLRAQHDASRDLRERQMQVFSAPVVDANAVEQLRQQMLAQHEQMSRRVSQAMVDVSRVLTPEQRTALMQRVRDHAPRGHALGDGGEPVGMIGHTMSGMGPST